MTLVHERLGRVLDQLRLAAHAEARRKAIRERNAWSLASSRSAPPSELITPPSNATGSVRAASILSAPAALGHVWTAPALQEESGVRLAVGCKSCVRPVRAARDRWP
jgi:hypothetical protein